MTRAIVFAAMLSLVACRESARPDAGVSAAGVGVTLAPVQAGAKWQVRHANTLAFSAVMNQPDGSTVQGEAGSDDLVTFSVEVLAVEGGDVIAARLTFTEAQEKDPNAASAALPIEGNAYVVEWGAKAATVKRDDGKPMTPREGALVNSHADLVRVTEVQRALAKKPAPANVELPDVAQAFATMYVRREDAKGGPPSRLNDVSAKLEERGDTVVLHVKGALKTFDPTMTLFSMLTGTIELSRATGVISSMKIEGPVEMDMKGKGKTSGRLLESVDLK